MNEVTLYHNDMSVCAAKVRMALAEKGISWDGVHLNLRAGDAQGPDYARLNPNKVVPTLVHHGMPIIESNVILEYLEDTWPQSALRPSASLDRARMRIWMKQLDESVHSATGTVSTCVAFRFQHLKRSSEELQRWFAGMVDPARRERSKQAIELGMDAPVFAPAVSRFLKLATDMDDALRSGPWLAGSAFSLADIAYAPYTARLCHLGFDDLIAERPRVADWRERLFERPSYQTGVEAWFNPSYLEIFDQHREAARTRVRHLTADIQSAPR